MEKVTKTESLAFFIAKNHIKVIEGKIHPQQKTLISNLFAENLWIKNVLEIGFNAGHSADWILSQREDINLTSVDIGEHKHTKTCADFIKNKYPNRFELKVGDSQIVLPQIKQRFDFIFIDGGHSEDVPLMDIINCRKLSTKGTIVLLDDYGTKEKVLERVNVAYNTLKRRGFIKQLEKPTNIKDYWGWVLYKYV